MLIPSLPQAEESLSPPPYTPTSSISAEAPDGILETSLRGGDVHPSFVEDNYQFQSAWAYFEDRPCTVQYPSYLLHYPLTFPLNPTRDDFAFPQPEDRYHSRDVLERDWDTFLNYLLPPEIDPMNSKGGLGRPRSKGALRNQDRIEAVLAEWHDGFFAPRGIRLEAHFPASYHRATTPPPPFTSTANVAYYPEVRSSSDSGHGDWCSPHHQGGHHNSQRGGCGRDHHHRRRSSSSSSSSSSESSIASISTSDFSGADPDQVRHSIATFRQDPNSKAKLSSMIRQFKLEIRAAKRQHRDAAHGMRGLKRENSRELKAQGKQLKNDLKGFIKEAKALRKADRKVRKAERKGRRAQRRAEKRGLDVHAKSARKVAKAEAKALRAQRKVVEADELARCMAAEAEARARVRGQHEGIMREGLDDRERTRGQGAGERVRQWEPTHTTRGGQWDLEERTRLLAVSDTKGQETGVVDT
ncbi:MAG: hypothetical protein Q9218_000658 [Villophora microphyllina]